MGDEIVQADKAFELDKQVDSCKQELGRNFLLLGKTLKVIRDSGFSNILIGDEEAQNGFDVYLASKKIGRTSGYEWVRIYETYVEKFGIDESKLAEIGWDALVKLLPIINDENRDKWLEKAEALSISDLKTEINAEKIKEKHDKIKSSQLDVKTDPREKDDVRKVDVIQGLNDLADESVDAIVTYPSFSEDEEYGHSADRQIDWLSGASRVLKLEGIVLLFVNTESLPSVSNALRQTGFSIIRDIVWVHKPKTVSQGLQKAHGTVIWAKKGNRYVYNIAEPTTDVWNIFSKAKYDDPRDLPEELVLKVLEMGTDPKQLILDPFCGYGTILSIAKKIGREIVGFETDENSYGMTISRLK